MLIHEIQLADQSPDYICGLVDSLYQLVQEDPNLSRQLGYQIQPKVARAQDQLRRLLSYRGPDDETVRVLEHNLDTWRQRPDTFWSEAGDPSGQRLNAEGHIIRSYLRARGDDA